MVIFNGQLFRAERKKKRLSQAQLAEQADTTVRYVRDLENGKKSNPSAALVYQISAALELPMETLMMDKEGDD